MKRRIVVGITGASGSVYGLALLKALRVADVEIHLILSDGARRTMSLETALTPDDFFQYADHLHDDANVGASIASGSFLTEGMIVIPCSIKSAAAIAYGFNDRLIARAADVSLKERRRTVLVIRETPLHVGHLRTLTQLAEIGATILPPIPAMYTRPESVEEIVGHTVGKVLDQFAIPHQAFRRWTGASASA